MADDELPAAIQNGFDRLLSVQRPLVLAHLRGIRRRHPDASPEQVIRILERRYLAAVTSGGAAVGASAVIPGVGTAASLALSGVETAGFLEASALFAQSVTEVHGIAVVEPERARSLVMAMMLGSTGQELVRQFAGQIGTKGAVPRTAYWGEVITNSLPKALLGQLTDRLRHSFVRHFAVRQGGSVVGRLFPFGVGAAIGGTGNHLLGRRVVRSTREAFPPAPVDFPAELEPRTRTKGAKLDAPRRRLPLPRLRKRPSEEQPALPPGE